MYGLPAYNEIDPTLFLTITYAFIFGIMFGDLGQGLCLLIGGLIVYKTKKMDLAGIICAAGVFSCIFGALFGSFFGFEFESFISPLNSMITLPFLGSINIVLVAAFLFGSFVIISTMIINIANAIKQKNLGKALFGPKRRYRTCILRKYYCRYYFIYDRQTTSGNYFGGNNVWCSSYSYFP